MKKNISYKITGYGDSIIFIHGIGSRHYTWNGFIEELKDEYQCITYNLRGHGESGGRVADGGGLPNLGHHLAALPRPTIRGPGLRAHRRGTGDEVQAEGPRRSGRAVP